MQIVMWVQHATPTDPQVLICLTRTYRIRLFDTNDFLTRFEIRRLLKASAALDELHHPVRFFHVVFFGVRFQLRLKIPMYLGLPFWIRAKRFFPIFRKNFE